MMGGFLPTLTIAAPLKNVNTAHSKTKIEVVGFTIKSTYTPINQQRMLYPNIPAQLHGDFDDIVSMHCANAIDTAIRNFEKVQMRLFSVNEWHTLSDQVKVEFVLFDSETNKPTHELKVDNLIRIDIPGPGNHSGKGYDWTKAIGIQNEPNNEENPFVAITIKPCSAPANDAETVAHFYTEKSSNTFIIRRVGTCIYAEVHGRNQEENTVAVPLLDTIRNKAVQVGASLGLGGLNWLGFTDALLKDLEK